ncbi:hypothetical protein LTI14_10615 [Nesterenkonia sp. YGD6]|uniref:hypothetical protein n=1 Tax=Nesterenkonia sp. YGD6 TaxID=2901231 RepID=UPI001F4CB65E|nr:hypothetical protein [Nesterenkonia sp. YGD6]MCH8563662.1 hypothetical protein [Nesterenkonia sp. YGD6]
MQAITDSFDLINTARAGFNLLADQVNPLVAAGANDRVIEALYSMPDGATGQNLRSYATRTAEERERDLARMWLTTVISHYESWAASLEVDYGIANSARGAQFPSVGHGSGYTEVFSQLTPSSVMHEIYESSVLVHRHWIPSDPDVQSALKLYRYYKEIRNSLVHSDGHADERISAASKSAAQEVVSLQERTSIRSTSVMVLEVGDPINITMTLVKDLIDILQRLVSTIDSQILLSTVGLAELTNRWRQHHGSSPLKVSEKKSQRPGWFTKNISEDLKMPQPLGTTPQESTWSQSSREAAIDYCTRNNLVVVRG